LPHDGKTGSTASDGDAVFLIGFQCDSIAVQTADNLMKDFGFNGDFAFFQHICINGCSLDTQFQIIGCHGEASLVCCQQNTFQNGKCRSGGDSLVHDIDEVQQGFFAAHEFHLYTSPFCSQCMDRIIEFGS